MLLNKIFSKVAFKHKSAQLTQLYYPAAFRSLNARKQDQAGKLFRFIFDNINIFQGDLIRR